MHETIGFSVTVVILLLGIFFNRSDMKELRGEMGSLRSEVRGEIKDLRGEINNLRNDINAQTEILRQIAFNHEHRITSLEKKEMYTLEDHIETMKRYIEMGIEPGSCTRAILENDLKGACGRADITTRYILFDIVQWMYNNAPQQCQGSPAKVHAWLRHGGMKGLKNG